MSDYPMLISNKLHSFRNFRQQYSNVCIGNRVPAVYRIGEREHFLSLSYISHTDNVIAFRKEPCPSFIYGSFGFVRLLSLYTCSLRR